MGIRTPDLLIANETLYQLSYDPTQSRPGLTRGLRTSTQAQRSLGHYRRYTRIRDQQNPARQSDNYGSARIFARARWYSSAVTESLL